MENKKIIQVELDDFMMIDKLSELSIEYSVSENYLVNIAIKKLIDDIELIRDIRNYKTSHLD